MIVGPSKYSKDPSIPADGIMLTLPVQFFEERNMTTEQFKKHFEKAMADEDTVCNFKLTNLPKQDIAFVYLVFDKQVQYRLNFVQYERNKSKTFIDSVDGKKRRFLNENWIIFTGPVVKPPHDWPQKGFQGFRYTTTLF